MRVIQDHSQPLRLSQRANILYVGRVLHPSLSKITVTSSLMQVQLRDVSISIVKNISRDRTVIAVCY